MLLCKSSPERLSFPLCKHQLNLAGPCEAGFCPTGQEVTNGGLHSTVAPHPAGALLLSPHPRRKGCGGTTFPLDSFTAIGTKAEMSTTLQKYSLPSSRFPPSLVNWRAFPSSPPAPRNGFLPACLCGSTLWCSKSSREGKEVKRSLNITPHMQALMAHHTLFCLARVGKLGHTGMEKERKRHLRSSTRFHGVPALRPPALLSPPHSSRVCPTVPWRVCCHATCFVVKTRQLLAKQKNTYFQQLSQLTPQQSGCRTALNFGSTLLPSSFSSWPMAGVLPQT